MGCALDLLLEPQLVADLLLDELKIISSHALIVPFEDGHFYFYKYIQQCHCHSIQRLH